MNQHGNRQKEKLKVRFTDYWMDLNKPEGNYFYEVLSRHFDLEISADPEIVFYSNYGTDYLNYHCLRVFFSAENERPDFSGCDYAITFDHSDNPAHLRFPLWALYYLSYLNSGGAQRLDQPRHREALLADWKARPKFCCFIVSNPAATFRNEFFLRLDALKHVDSAGKHLNNIGYFLEGGSLEKFRFIQDYRFVISFENSSYPGYTTEKLLEPLLAGCIPIYHGDPQVDRDFNPARFVWYNDFTDEKAVIDRVLALDADPVAALELLGSKCFTEGQPTIDQWAETLEKFLLRIAEGRKQLRPRARQPLHSTIHRVRVYRKKLHHLLRTKFTARLSK